MIPAIEFTESNFTFTKPEGMTDKECSSLKVWKGRDSDGYPVIISKWKPTKEDLDELNKGGSIYLSICGQGMPPVSLYTEYPWNEVRDHNA